VLDGVASVTLCGGTGGDTKLACYDDTGGCPTGGPLACNDDACGTQSSVSWSTDVGASYVLQLGAFPGASPTSGTFDVTETPPAPCTRYDDGSTEGALGLTAGGEMGWLHYFDCPGGIVAVESAYGSAMFPGSVTNGAPSRVALYAGGDPASGPGSATLVNWTTTAVVNGDTDILNAVPVTGDLQGGGWALCSADQSAGEFPGPMDDDGTGPEAWVVGSTTGPGTLDLANLSNNDVPPLQMQALGYSSLWLLRILKQLSW
jgi:hypothetical protein